MKELVGKIKVKKYDWGEIFLISFLVLFIPCILLFIGIMLAIDPNDTPPLTAFIVGVIFAGELVAVWPLAYYIYKRGDYKYETWREVTVIEVKSK